MLLQQQLQLYVHSSNSPVVKSRNHAWSSVCLGLIFRKQSGHSPNQPLFYSPRWKQKKTRRPDTLPRVTKSQYCVLASTIKTFALLTKPLPSRQSPVKMKLFTLFPVVFFFFSALADTAMGAAATAEPGGARPNAVTPPTTMKQPPMASKPPPPPPKVHPSGTPAPPPTSREVNWEFDTGI